MSKDTRRRIKIFNVEYPGEPCEFNHNGTKWVCEHGETVNWPGGVIALVKDCIIKRHQRFDPKARVWINGGWFKKYEVVELDPEYQDIDDDPIKKNRAKLADSITTIPNLHQGFAE